MANQIRPSHLRRALRAPVMGALVLALSGVLALPSGAATGNPSDLVEGCEDAPSASSDFSDYNSLDAREKTIVDCLSDGYKGDANNSDYVLKGTGGRVNFDQTISRAQFAVILNRVGDYLGLDAKSAPNSPTFADVPTSHPFYDEIEELFARGLTNGAGNDTQDVDNDGNTSEDIYLPAGEVSYAQVLAFVYRLLTEAGESLASDQSHNEANGLDCGFFDDEKDLLDDAGFLIFENTPSDCRASSVRALVFDLVAVAFDETVESGLAENPFAPTFGSITLTTDASTATVGQTITATVTVLDPDDEPVQGQRVDVFGVSPTGGFTASGNPKDPGNLSIAGTGRYGSGASPAVIDGSDPLTDADGKVTVSVQITGASGASFDLYAFQGDSATPYADADAADGSASRKVSVTFTAVPADILITSNADGYALRYSETNRLAFQVVDASDQAIRSQGLSVIAERYQNGQLVERRPLTTGDDGVASWDSPPPADPNPDSSGDTVSQTFAAIYDADNSGTFNEADTVTSSEDLTVTFRDAPESEPGSALIELPNENSARGDRMGALISGPAEPVMVTVVNVYGDPAIGAVVSFSRNNVPTQTITDGSGSDGNGAPGVVQFTPVKPNSASGITFTASVDASGVASDVPAANVAGSTAGVTIQWVDAPPTPTLPGGAVEISNLWIAGRDASAAYGYPSSGAITTQRRQLLHDQDDIYILGSSLTACDNQTPPTSRASFLTLIDADLDANDLLDVRYRPGGQSCWVLQVVEDGSGGGPVLP